MLKESLLGTAGCLPLVSYYYTYQVLPILQVQPYKPLSTPCLVKWLTDEWQEVLVWYCETVQSSVGNAESEGSVLFEYK